MRVEQVVVREVRALAEDEQRRHAHVLEARRLRRHLAVRGDDGGLAVAVAHATVVPGLDVRREVLDDELARREVELALVVAPLDQLVEGDVRLVDARVLGRGERDVAGEEDRRVEEDELRDELRRARGELERETPAERVADQDRLARADRLDDRVEVRADVPRRLPRRVAVPEQIGREDVVVGELARRAARSAGRGCGRRGGRRRAERPGRPTRGARASLGRGERFERVRHHLGPALVALLHERPDHGAVAVDEERAAVRRAVRLVEDAVRLRGRAVRPEVGRERVLGAELLLPRLTRGATDRTRRRRSPFPRRGTTAGSPGGRAPRPRRRA